MGIVAKPHYRTSETAHPTCVAIGPCWTTPDRREVSLAGSQPDTATLSIAEQTPDSVRFTLKYATDPPITEEYVLTSDALALTASTPDTSLSLTVPLLLTDGGGESTIDRHPAGYLVTHSGHQFLCEALGTGVHVHRLDHRAPNRNAIYDIASFTSSTGSLRIRLSFP